MERFRAAAVVGARTEHDELDDISIVGVVASGKEVRTVITLMRHVPIEAEFHYALPVNTGGCRIKHGPENYLRYRSVL